MAHKSGTNKRPVEQYDHKGKQRINNPPVGLVDAKSDAAEGKKAYAYDPHLDPTLVWAGKAERTSFEIPTVSLHVHERIDPRSIIEAVRKKNGSDYEQMATDARDWNDCGEPVLRRIAKQKGVKSRATFKSRLLAAVSAAMRRLARAA